MSEDIFFENKFLKDYYELLKNKYLELAENILDYRKTNNIKPLGTKEAYAQVLTIFSLLNNSLDLFELDLSKFDFITDGSDDCSFDLINITEDKKIIEIFDFKRGEDGFKITDLRTLDGNIQDYIIDRTSYEELDNTLVKNQLEQIKTIIDSNSNVKIKIYLFREKNSKPDETFLKKIEKMKASYKDYHIEIILKNKIDIINLLKESIINNFGSSKNDFNIDLDIETGYIKDNVIIGIMSLYNLIYFINNCNNSGLNDLYKLNVRGDLENKELIENIKDTILTKPEKFLYFHNGITITCNDFIPQKNNLITIKNPQIVNGCQSTSAIYKYFKKVIDENNIIKDNNFDKIEILKSKDTEVNDMLKYINENYKQIEYLKKAFIQIKILSVNSDKLFIEKISEYSNKQISIDGYELRSNDLVNQIIENFVKKYGYQFKRKKGDEIIDFKKCIEIDDLYQILYAIQTKDPQGAKNIKKKIFQLNPLENSYLDILSKLKLNFILSIFIMNYSFFEVWGDEQWKYYYILAIKLYLDNKQKDILELNEDEILKIGFKIKEIILNIKETDYYKKKDILRNYGTEIWEKINNRICFNQNKEKNSIIFNLEDFIQTLKNLGAKGALTMSLRGSNLNLTGNKFKIETKTKISFAQINTLESKHLIGETLKELYNIEEVEIIIK